jgi:hypothetical protein
MMNLTISVQSFKRNMKHDKAHRQYEIVLEITTYTPKWWRRRFHDDGTSIAIHEPSAIKRSYTLVIEAKGGRYIQWWISGELGVFLGCTWFTATTQHNNRAYRHIGDAFRDAISQLALRVK